MHILIVGAGIFGVVAATELLARGHHVTLLDPGPLPHPLAASTDISKLIRMDYGADPFFTQLGYQALQGWKDWNALAPRPLYHATGILFAARAPMHPGQYEYESYQQLSALGIPLERLDAQNLIARFPAWKAETHQDGYFNPEAGWAESGAVVAWLLARFVAAGGTLIEEPVQSIAEGPTVMLRSGPLKGDRILCCAGSWTAQLLPELSDVLRPIGHPVFHLQPTQPEHYQAQVFPPFSADISQTGYYGFPITPDGRVKIAHHGQGRLVDPNGAGREVTAGEIAAFRQFLQETFPGLAEAPIVYTRVCVYSDSPDGDFWVGESRPDVIVGAGGSGHAFKFAPVLGKILADAVEGKPIPTRLTAHKTRLFGREAARSTRASG